MTHGRRTKTFAEKVGQWLQQNRGAYCDKCIARELDLSKRQANRATNALSGVTNLIRGTGTCSICGAQRKVTAAV
jgi:hypothetical protein